MQIDHHIRMCPVIAEAGGLEPYPQPMAAFAGAPTGTVQARIFDVSVQPPVELTSGGAITLASGLAASGLTNIPNSYVLDMGNAGVTSVVDAYTREGLEVVVMFEDSGGSQSPRYVKVTCNDADHVDALYPDGAIYADASSSVTGTSFPNGSIYRPVRNLGDACSILTARGASLLDCKGTWDGTHNTAGGGVGGCRAADIGTALSSARAIIRTRSTAAWYPDNSGDVIDLVDCSVISVNVPFGFSLSNFTNGTFFGGAPRLVNCRVQTAYFTGNGTRYGAASCTNCKIEGAIYLSANTSPGCYSADFLGCIWSTVQTVDFTSTYNFGFVTPTFVDCAGPITIANLGAGNGLAMTGMRGVGDITLAASVSSSVASVLVTGDYNSLVNNAGIGSGSITEQKSAAYVDVAAVEADTQDIQSRLPAALVGGRMDADVGALQAGVVTATEAPALANLDAAVSTRATQAQVATELTNYDAATGTEAAAISAAIAALPDSAAVQTAAEAAIAAQEPIAANVTQVAASAVVGVADFRADISSLATSAALATVDGNVDAILVDTAALDSRLTTARASNLDNLDAAVSSRAAPGAAMTISGTITTLDALDSAQDTQHATTRTQLNSMSGATFDTATDSLEQIRNNLGGGGGSTIGPELHMKAPILERPEPTATVTYTIVIATRDGGALTDPDSNTINVTAANAAGTDRSANLGAATATRLRAGQYTVTYDVAYDHAIEELVFTFSCAFSTVAHTFTEPAQVLDTSNATPSLVLSGS